MFGLVVLLIMFGYLAVAVTATVLAVRSVKRAGGGRRDQWRRGGLVALIFYLIPFWDAIPLWIAFNYKCASEAELVVRKDAAQWVRENPREDLSVDATGIGKKWIEMGDRSRYHINQRLVVDLFGYEEIYLTLSKKHVQIVDLKSGERLVEFTDFLSGKRFGADGFEGLKVWNRRDSCSEGGAGARGKFSRLEREYEQLARRRE